MQPRCDHRHVEADQPLPDGEALYRSLFTLAPSGIVLLDEEGRFVQFNDEAHELLGYTRAEFARLRATDLHPVEKRGGVLAQLARAFIGGGEFECGHRAKSGELLHVLVKARPVEIGGARRLLCVFQDNTPSRRAEQALRESEERFRAIFEQAAVGMAQVDSRTGLYLRVNDKLCQILGYAREELLDQGWQDLTHPNDLMGDRDSYAAMLATHRAYAKQKRFVRKDGQHVWVNVTVAPMWPPGAEPTSHVSVVEDVTRRKRAEEALRESEQRFRVAFQTSPDAVNINRLGDGLFVAVNEGFTRITGFTEAEAVGRTSLELEVWADPADRARVVAGLAQYGFVENFEAQFRRKDGSVLSGLLSARLIVLRGEQYLLSITRDVSDWKRAEEERDRLKSGLHQAAKMEAIGQLAGGVAHDFNNLLTVILAGAEELRGALARGTAPEPEIAEEISAAGTRARELTRQLLAFARRQVIAPVPLDLNALVRGGENFLRRALGEGIELAVSLQPDLGTVRCDPGHIEQVVLNLAVNAGDAMPNGGRLTVETSNVQVDEALARLHPGVEPGPFVRLSVRDTGLGMTPEVKAHLFEPFFTTKPVGKGTGLGLATVYGIVKQSGGFVRVESEPGRGTRFELLFPRIGEPPLTPSSPAPVVARSGTETVLVVEDDAQVRAITVRALRSGGYRVHVAADGREALDLAAREEGRLHLLLTDVLMPGLDGREVADALRRDRRDLRVLYVSGHAEEAIVKRGVLEPGIDFLPKPFTATSLLARVRAVLDAR